MNSKKKCFVIMPVSKTRACTEDEWTGIFDHMIKPAVTGSRLGFECERAKPRTGAFIKDILEGLNRADVVIADLTDRNPNVCYELGIRHTLKNRTIIIAQNIKHVPSDLRAYWIVEYKKDLTGANVFKTKVRDILREMQKDPDKTDSPVADFLQLKNIDLLSTHKSENYKKLTALVTEISGNLNLLNVVVDRAKENQDFRNKKKGKISYSTSRFDTTCVDLLISTYYVTVQQDIQQLLYDVKFVSVTCNSRLNNWSIASNASNIEDTLIKYMPAMKRVMTALLKEISKIRIDYVNDNYKEPSLPPPLLSNTEHQQYITSS